MKKFPIIIFLPIPILLLFIAGCINEVEQSDSNISIEPTNFSVINETNQSNNSIQITNKSIDINTTLNNTINETYNSSQNITI